MLSINQSDKALRSRLRQLGVNWDDTLEMSSTTLGRTTLLPCNRTIIRLRSVPKSVTDYGTLAHEIFHAVTFILTRIGMSLTNESDEAYAYLIGYLTKEIYKHI